MKYYIGIDLGGTNVRVAKVDETGKIVWDLVEKSYGKEGPKERVRDIIFSMLDKVDNLKECEGIGICVPGPVDTKTNLMTLSSNLVGFLGYPIAQMIEERYGLPVFVDNDANCAGLAEALLGAGKDLPIVYFITQSTGVGGALVVDGKVVSGKSGYAGEIGNIIIADGRKKINHLNAGSTETEVSGTAFGRRAQERMGDRCTSAHQVFELAKEGDKDALELIDDMCHDFARCLAAVALVCDPHCFVIGGGMSHSSDQYFPKLEEYYHELVHPGMRDTHIYKAKLEEPGVLGAAMLPKANL